MITKRAYIDYQLFANIHNVFPKDLHLALWKS